MKKIKQSYDELLALGELDLFLEKVREHTSIKIRNRQFAGLDHDDVIQEVLLKVYKTIKQYDPTKSKVSTFVGHIIDNKIRDCFRAAGSNQNLINVNSYPYTDVIDNEDALMGYVQPVEEPLYNCVEYTYDIVHNAGLTEKELEMFKLKVAGYNMTEIADIMGCTRATVHNIYKRIKEKFEELQ